MCGVDAQADEMKEEKEMPQSIDNIMQFIW